MNIIDIIVISGSPNKAFIQGDNGLFFLLEYSDEYIKKVVDECKNNSSYDNCYKIVSMEQCGDIYYYLSNTVKIHLSTLYKKYE